jgi:hypothetical protein
MHRLDTLGNGTKGLLSHEASNRALTRAENGRVCRHNGSGYATCVDAAMMQPLRN